MTLAVLSTMNDTSPLGVVTVRVLLAASHLVTVPEALMTVAFGVFALGALAAAGFAAGVAVVGLAVVACAANMGLDRASAAAAIVKLRNIRINILLVSKWPASLS
jgi:hypothetical protein